MKQDTPKTFQVTRRESIFMLAAGAVCMAVDTSMLAQAASAAQGDAAQGGGADAVGHEDAAIALANTVTGNPWSSHDTPEMVAAALVGLPTIPAGPFQPTWASIEKNYSDPEWFRDDKFGIYMHLGIFSVPAHGSEWYVRYMYGGNKDVMAWHTEHYGPPTKFGYKDFFPMYTMAKWDPDAWADLFKKSGAKYVLAPGEHHDGFSNWDSKTNPYNSVNYGPRRDIDGDLIKALRKVGLKTGVSDHSAYHFNFIPALAGSDEFDPKWADFYNVADKSTTARIKFMHDWVQKRIENIDLYKPDLLFFDMSTDHSWDPLKEYVAAYYYNRARQWGKQVAITAKGAAWVSGQIMDYEREGRAPMEMVNWAWEPDDPITDKFGYVEGQKVFGPEQFVFKIVENVSKNGNLLLNISPKADGTIPQEQQDTLLGIGKWLDVNGEGIYKTRTWTKYGEGPAADAAAAAMAKVHANGNFDGRMNGKNIADANVTGGGLPRHGYTPQDIRFTRNGDTLYAFVMKWPEDGSEVVVTSLTKGLASAGKVAKVELLGHAGRLAFTQDAAGLRVKMPAEKPCDFAYALKVTGLKLG